MYMYMYEKIFLIKSELLLFSYTKVQEKFSN